MKEAPVLATVPASYSSILLSAEQAANGSKLRKATREGMQHAASTAATASMDPGGGIGHSEQAMIPQPVGTLGFARKIGLFICISSVGYGSKFHAETELPSRQA